MSITRSKIIRQWFLWTDILYLRRNRYIDRLTLYWPDSQWCGSETPSLCLFIVLNDYLTFIHALSHCSKAANGLYFSPWMTGILRWVVLLWCIISACTCFKCTKMSMDVSTILVRPLLHYCWKQTNERWQWSVPLSFVDVQNDLVFKFSLSLLFLWLQKPSS